MRTNYAALGVNLDGSALMIKLIMAGHGGKTVNCIPLSDELKQGLPDGGAFVGGTLIIGLAAWHPDMNLQALVLKKTTPAPYMLTFDRHTVMRPQRVGLGLQDDAAGPAMLVVRTYDGDQPIGEDALHSLNYLMGLDGGIAESVIGETMLRRLAAMHPDVLPPSFPRRCH